VHLDVKTNYPWDKNVAIKIVDAPESGMELTFRVPSWCKTATYNSNTVEPGMHKVQVTKGQTLNIVLPMKAELYAANPMLEQANGMTAIKRGPVVYCIEGTDIEDGYKIDDLALSIDTQFEEIEISDLPYQMVGLKANLNVRPQGDELYFKLAADAPKKVAARFIPYFAWANREEQDMSIWLPRA
jgi:DUF1680 family protein